MTIDVIFLDDLRNIEDVTWVKYPNYNDVHYVRRECDFMFAVMHLDNISRQLACLLLLIFLILFLQLSSNNKNNQESAFSFLYLFTLRLNNL